MLGVVGDGTRGAVEGDWASLEGRVEEGCAKGLSQQLEAMHLRERKYVALNPADVFFSFVDKSGGNNVNLVTFSFPDLEKILSEFKEVKMWEGKMKEDGECTQGMLEVLVKEVRARQQYDSKQLFSDNNIVIGNYSLGRSSPETPWMVRTAGQANMENVYRQGFYNKWKLCLKMSIVNEMTFRRVLRERYAKDLTIVAAAVGFNIFFIAKIMGLV